MKYDIGYSNPIHDARAVRSRGVKGREQATQRQALIGDGPGGGIPQRGKAIIIWGLPKNSSQLGISKILERYNPSIPLGDIAVIPHR